MKLENLIPPRLTLTLSRRQRAGPANTASAEGAGAAADCKPQPGFYGDNGNTASVCPAGFYCAGSSAAVRCPEGTSSAQGATAVAQCSVLRAYYGRCWWGERGVLGRGKGFPTLFFSHAGRVHAHNLYRQRANGAQAEPF